MAGKNRIAAFVTGTISKKTLLTRLLPLDLGVLLATYFLANIFFSAPFDWRYMVISNLALPEVSPGYWIADIGMTLAGIFLIPLLGYYQRRLGKICHGSTSVGTFFLFLGIIGMIGSALPLGNENFHVISAAVGFLGIILAGSFYILPIIKDHWKGGKQFNMRLMGVAIFVLWAPVVGLAANALYTLIAQPWWGWQEFSWISRYDVPVIFSFPFWEWLMFVGLLVFLVLLAIVVPETMNPPAERSSYENPRDISVV